LYNDYIIYQISKVLLTTKNQKEELKMYKRLSRLSTIILTVALVLCVLKTISFAQGLVCLTDNDCDDGNPCTADSCVVVLVAGVCLNQNDDGESCNDGAFCNGTDTCSSGACINHSGNPCPSDTECNEQTNMCEGGGRGNPCLAETLYGEDSAEVNLMRYVRDVILNQTIEGQELIRVYYEWSPIITRLMQEDEVFKEDVQGMIEEVLLLIGGN
jgi:hypothetical protein